MDQVSFRFPSERPETGCDAPSGYIHGRQRNIVAPSPAGPGHRTSTYQPSYNPPTLDPYRPSPPKISTHLVRIGSQLYTFVREIEPPTDEKGVMSDGVRVLKTSSGMLVVEKRLRMDDKFSKDRAGAEVKALEQVKNIGGSPHINTLVEALYTQGDSHSSLILDYCEQGSLKDVIDSSRRRGELISEGFCWHTFLQLSYALAVCHNGVRNPFDPENRPREWNTLCHIDIKPANVFLKSKKAPGFEDAPWPTVVLGDFGCVVTKRDVKNGKVSSTSIPFGTDGWYPPENSDEWRRGEMGVYGRQTDIWQLGGVILVMCHKVDYPSMSFVTAALPCGPKYSTSLSKAVQNCMATKPSLRPTAIDVAKGVSGAMGRRGT